MYFISYLILNFSHNPLEQIMLNRFLFIILVIIQLSCKSPIIEHVSLIGHSMSVTKIVFSADSKYVISAGRDNAIIIWDIEKKRKILTLVGHSNEIKALALTPDMKYLASSGIEKKILIWNEKRYYRKISGWD